MQVYNIYFKLTSVYKQPSNRYFWGERGKWHHFSERRMRHVNPWSTLFPSGMFTFVVKRWCSRRTPRGRAGEKSSLSKTLGRDSWCCPLSREPEVWRAHRPRRTLCRSLSNQEEKAGEQSFVRTSSFSLLMSVHYFQIISWPLVMKLLWKTSNRSSRWYYLVKDK